MISKARLEELFQDKAIKKCPPDIRAAERLLQRAFKDLRTAERNINEDPECAFTYAYTAMMRAGLALMESRGFRTASTHKHQTVVRFVAAELGPEHSSDFEGFDILRIKRNRFVYEPDLPCSVAEATAALRAARPFVDLLNEMVERESGQAGLGFDGKGDPGASKAKPPK